MSKKFEDQLKKLVNSDPVDKAIDDLPDDEDEENTVKEEMLPVEYEEKESKIQPTEDSDLYDDYRYARSNYYGLIGRSNAAIDLILQIAQMSEHPRAVEVAANLMKTSADITKDLIELQKVIEKNGAKGGNDNQPPGQYTQHNHYYSKEEEANRIEKELDSLDDTDETKE